ncbi:M13 family metallopeptidase [Kordiimonas sp.]|uniref:M13 family metallopeptidase n=1 Tax=Kordiimonas sp. TaxID=1970157 RepID=UPI003A91AB5E
MIRSVLKSSVAATALLLAACGNSNDNASNDAAGKAVAEMQASANTSPAIGDWGVDLTARDEAVTPGNDFFNYANGTWMAEHDIPADRSSYGVGLIVHERAQERVKAIIEELGAKGGEKGTPEQKVGDYYASWMDTATLNELGAAPLKADLDRIAGISDLTGLTEEFGRANYVGGNRVITAGLGIDPRDPNKYNMNIGLGGMGLPDRDYYLEDNERFNTIRAAYKDHIAEMLTLAGIEDAAAKADAIMALETKVAELQWIRADRRDRDKTFNPTTVAKLSEDYPGFDWDLYLASGGIEGLEEINVSHPDTINPLIALLSSEDLDTWKAYLSYHLISNNASLLSEEIDAANFRFWGGVMRGQEQQLDRWKRGVSRVGAKTGLGEALGQIYVKRHFPESSKAKMETLVENLRKAYGERIDTLPWMGDDTKVEARAKLAAFRAKIGYPDNWMDLGGIEIDRADLFGNARRITKFFEDFDVARLKRPTDKEEWFMMPQTVNAYYLSNFNEIVFPAAILEPPFFDPNADPAVNYGAIGAIIGHEMGHGFDDQGSKSDAQGIKRNWWTDADREAFESRTKVLGDQFSSYEAVPGAFVDGNFTMGENIGDLGGLEVAYLAYKLSLNGEEAPVIDGLTGDQRFFLAYAQSWRTKVRDEATLERLKSDPHSPAKYRVNGIVRNVDAWYDAFGVKEGDELYIAPDDRVKIW